jgi:hypothetical protein
LALSVDALLSVCAVPVVEAIVGLADAANAVGGDEAGDVVGTAILDAVKAVLALDVLARTVHAGLIVWAVPVRFTAVRGLALAVLAELVAWAVAIGLTLRYLDALIGHADLAAPAVAVVAAFDALQALAVDADLTVLAIRVDAALLLDGLTETEVALEALLAVDVALALGWRDDEAGAGDAGLVWRAVVVGFAASGVLAAEVDAARGGWALVVVPAEERGNTPPGRAGEFVVAVLVGLADKGLAIPKLAALVRGAVLVPCAIWGGDANPVAADQSLVAVFVAATPGHVGASVSDADQSLRAVFVVAALDVIDTTSGEDVAALSIGALVVVAAVGAADAGAADTLGVGAAVIVSPALAREDAAAVDAALAAVAIAVPTALGGGVGAAVVDADEIATAVAVLATSRGALPVIQADLAAQAIAVGLTAGGGAAEGVLALGALGAIVVIPTSQATPIAYADAALGALVIGATEGGIGQTDRRPAHVAVAAVLVIATPGATAVQIAYLAVGAISVGFALELVRDTGEVFAPLENRTIGVDPALPGEDALPVQAGLSRGAISVAPALGRWVDALPALAGLAVIAIIVVLTLRLEDALTEVAAEARWALVVHAALWGRHAESELALLVHGAVGVPLALGWWNEDADAGEAGFAEATVIIVLAAAGDGTDVVDALVLRQRAVVVILAEEGRDAAAGQAAKSVLAVLVVLADHGLARAYVAALIGLAVLVKAAVGSGDADAVPAQGARRAVLVAATLLHGAALVTQADLPHWAIPVVPAFDVVHTDALQHVADLPIRAVRVAVTLPVHHAAEVDAGLSWVAFTIAPAVSVEDALPVSARLVVRAVLVCPALGRVGNA